MKTKLSFLSAAAIGTLALAWLVPGATDEVGGIRQVSWTGEAVVEQGGADRPAAAPTSETGRSAVDVAPAQQDGEAEALEGEVSLSVHIEGEDPVRGRLVILDETWKKEREVRFKVWSGAPPEMLGQWDANPIEIAGLSPGAKEVVLYQPPFRVARAKVDPGSGRTELGLGPARRIEEAIYSGRLLDQEGFPVSGAIIRVRVPAATALEGPGDEVIAVDRSYFAGEGLVAGHESISISTLANDGSIRVESRTDTLGRFDIGAPAELGVALEVRIAVGSREFVRAMNHPRPAWGKPGERNTPPVIQTFVLEEVPSAFPGLAAGDRERYAISLLDRIDRAESADAVRDAEERLLAWNRALAGLPTHGAFAAEFDASERLLAGLFDDLAAAEGERPVPGDLVLDVTAREEVVREAVILVRALLDLAAADGVAKEPARAELAQILEDAESRRTE